MLRLFLVLSLWLLPSLSIASSFYVFIDDQKIFLSDIEVLPPFVEKAQAFIQGKSFSVLNKTQDRYGDAYAELFFDSQILQEALLERGWARRISGGKYKENEKAAITKRLGLWGLPEYEVKQANVVGKDIGSFQVVKGKVFGTYLAKKVLYINFDKDWKEDFTILIEKKDLRKMSREGFSPENLHGKTVMVRGLVEKYYGPMIKVIDINQLEILNDF